MCYYDSVNVRNLTQVEFFNPSLSLNNKYNVQYCV